MVNMTNYATPITTWTRFHVLLENSLHDMNESNDLGRKWISTFRPLLQAVGHEHSTWGRVQSNPGVVLLSTLWKSRTDYANFTQSPAHGNFLSALSSLLGPASTITSITVSLGHPVTHNYLQPGTQLRYVYFPIPISPASRSAIEAIQGPVYPHGVSLSGSTAESAKFPSAYRVRPERGWVDGTEERQGKECELLMWVLFWKGRDEEREFLEKVKVVKTRAGENGTSIFEGVVGVVENWERKLKELGAVEWVSEYVDFGAVPGGF